VGDYALIPVLIGASIWAFGLVFEAIADFQLKKFIKNPQNKGKIMDRGLWRYSRHPNYFGEIVLWWGIFIITLSTMDLWYLKIIGPLTITVLIIFVSGIPLLEKRYQDNAEYQKYKLRTSSLLPLPPKK
jgi:steroid 5-alpha reductase family enzyme